VSAAKPVTLALVGDALVAWRLEIMTRFAYDKRAAIAMMDMRELALFRLAGRIAKERKIKWKPVKPRGRKP
jgi:hypothetical protein